MSNTDQGWNGMFRVGSTRLLCALVGVALVSTLAISQMLPTPAGAASGARPVVTGGGASRASRDVSLVAVPAGPAPAARQPLRVPPSVSANAAWILSAQHADGAIPNYVNDAHLSPYLGNQAAQGLARASVVTQNAAFATAAWRWLTWYQAHEGAQGFVTDYVLSGATFVSTGDMDSTDAYAGTFLSAASATWAAAPDQSRLLALRSGIVNAVGAIEATQDTDGLTWAKPTWHVKYLMDQGEAYAGLKAVAPLAAALGDAALAARASADASRMSAAVAQLWNPAEGAFSWAVYDSGVRQSTNWSALYPDAMEQAWAVAYGLASPAQAKAITGHLLAAQPAWDRPLAPASVAGSSQPAGYWPVAGWALDNVGRINAASLAMTSIQTAADSTNRAWPFTPATAGGLIILATGGPAVAGLFGSPV